MFEGMEKQYGPQHWKSHDATIFQHVYTFFIPFVNSWIHIGWFKCGRQWYVKVCFLYAPTIN